jgi:MFS family permease
VFGGSEVTENRIPRLVYFITALELSMAINMYIIQPFFPLYLTELGATTLDIGLVLSVTSVVTIASRIPLGVVSDRVGRWPILPTGLLAFAGSAVLLSLAPSLVWVYPIQAVRALVSSGYMPTSHAIVSDLAPADRRAETIGVLLTAVGLGSFVGPAVGSVLLQWFGYRQIFLATALLPAVALVAVVAAVQRHRSSFTPSRRVADARLPFWTMLRQPNMINLCLYEVCFQFAQGVFSTLFAVYAKSDLLLGASLISILISVRGLTNFLIRTPIGRVSDRIGRRRPFFVAASTLALAYLLLAVAPNFAGLLVAMMVMGVGFGMYKVMSNTIFVENVPSGNRAAVLSLRFTSMSVGGAVGAFVAGVSSLVFATPILFLVCSGTVLLGLVSYSLVTR